MQVKDLSAAQFARLSMLLDEVFELAAERRQEWLALLSSRDPALAPLVADLLAADSSADAEHLIETRDALNRQFAGAVENRQTLVGRQFGPYRVTRKIGGGGMGSLWLAERADGLFARRVALKLVHSGLIGSALDERFTQERTILAALDHPGIARLLDAGIAEDGQPYLALEYVEGVALTEYCDRRRRDVSARIELFAQVLRAVQYAHTSLIVHRDLKPSNILVTKDGEIRLLDFGIAKLLTDGEAPETALTQVGGRLFTPEYASPEQIAGLRITAASDVYALGVVLYELLCGPRPYALKRATLGALEDAILSAAPIGPSEMALSEADAAARSTTPQRLRKTLSGDLDTIVLKALKKRPADRYGSANAMLQDLERYQRGEPVLARPESALYRFGKFFARHKLALGAAAATTVALACGLAVALWEADVAREQAVMARAESNRATAVQDFLLDLFRANSVEQPDPAKAQQTTARELLDLGGKRAEDSLGSAPQARAAVLGTLSDMYYQLGMNAEAAAQRMRQVTALKQAYANTDVRVADALIMYATDIADLPERGQVVAVLKEAEAILDSLHDETSDTRGRLLMLLAQANRYTAIDKMRAYADQAVALFEQRPAQLSSLVRALNYAASARLQQGDAVSAEATFQRAIATATSKDAGQVAWTVFPLTGLAEAQDALRKVEAAEQSYRSAVAAAQASYGPLHPETMLAEAKLGVYLHSTARREQGDHWMDEALAAVGKGSHGYTPPFVIAVLSGLRGRALLADGRLEDAARMIAVDLDDARANYPASVPLAFALRNQIALDTAEGRYDKAAGEVREANDIMQVNGTSGSQANRNRRLFDEARLLLARGESGAACEKLAMIAPPVDAARLPLDIDRVTVATLLAQARMQTRDVSGAIASAQDAYDRVAAPPLRKYYPLLEADAALWLGIAHHASGELQAARTNLEQAVALRLADNDRGQSPWLAQAQIALADCMVDLGRREDARVLLRQAAAIQSTHRALGPHFTQPLVDAQRRVQ